jgi:hypothetical protein
MIRAAATDAEEPGLHPRAAALDTEGFDLGSGHLFEAFARHLMVNLDAWQHDGFGEVAKRYLSRLSPQRGVCRKIDDNGDLLSHRAGARTQERRTLAAALATPSWLDPATGTPRL